MIIFTSLIHSLDQWALHGLYAVRTYSTTLFFIGVSEFGTIATVIGLTAGLVLWLMTREHYSKALGLVGAVGGTSLAVLGLKYLVARPRPDEFFQAYPEVWYSFPSWHAAGTAALAVYLSLQIFTLLPRRYRLAAQLLVLGLSLIVGFSRMYLGVHYASDVIAGLIIGGVCAYAASYLVQRYARPATTV